MSDTKLTELQKAEDTAFGRVVEAEHAFCAVAEAFLAERQCLPPDTTGAGSKLKDIGDLQDFHGLLLNARRAWHAADAAVMVAMES
jgi:hypothetical protein